MVDCISIFSFSKDDPKSRRPVAGLELRLAGVEGRSVLERGYVTDWDGAEAVWKQVVTGGLKVDPADHPILITEPALNPKTSRERTAEVGLWPRFVRLLRT